MLITAGLLVLWLLVLIQDLRERRVRVVVLVGVAGLSLPAAGWPWWPLVVAALVWPLRRRHQALWLAAPAVLVGLATGESSPAVAITTGAVAVAWLGGKRIRSKSGPRPMLLDNVGGPIPLPVPGRAEGHRRELKR